MCEPTELMREAKQEGRKEQERGLRSLSEEEGDNSIIQCVREINYQRPGVSPHLFGLTSELRFASQLPPRSPHMLSASYGDA